MSESGKCTKVRTWQEGDTFLYRVAFDGVEAVSTIRITGTQKATHGEDALLRWCNHHASQLTKPGIVDAVLNEEAIK